MNINSKITRSAAVLAIIIVIGILERSVLGFISSVFPSVYGFIAYQVLTDLDNRLIVSFLVAMIAIAFPFSGFFVAGIMVLSTIITVCQIKFPRYQIPLLMIGYFVVSSYELFLLFLTSGSQFHKVLVQIQHLFNFLQIHVNSEIFTFLSIVIFLSTCAFNCTLLQFLACRVFGSRFEIVLKRK